MSTIDLHFGCLDRRSFVKKTLVASAALIAGTASIGNLRSAGVAAHEATPASGSPLDAVELPMLEVTINADGTLEMPAEFPAGSVRLRVSSLQAGAGSILFIQPPEGITEDDIKAALSAPGIPDFMYQSVVNGGVEFLPGDGQNAALIQEIIFDLGAGAWYVAQLSETPSYRVLTAIGEPALVAIPAAVEVALSMYDFSFAAEIPAGPGIWKITNLDPTLHHMIIFSYPDALTDEQALELLLAGEGMSTPTSGLDPARASVVGATGMLSRDQGVYQTFDLQPGVHFATCFINDPGMETPHAMHGMTRVFTAV